jgi:hypothetical protein
MSNLFGKKLPSFPTWEKVYLDIKEKFIFDFFEDSQGIVVKNNNVYFFPKIANKSKIYFIFDPEKEILRQEEMPIIGFYPIYDKNEIIYLFKLDDDIFSEYRYHIIEFNINTNDWRILNTSGAAPKKRTDGKEYTFI